MNAVFGAGEEALETLLPGCLTGWEFARHESADKELRGHAALLCAASKDDDEDENPRWAADGKHLVFSGNMDGRYSIYTIRIDGTGLRRLTQGSAAVTPDWSPAQAR